MYKDILILPSVSEFGKLNSMQIASAKFIAFGEKRSFKVVKDRYGKYQGTQIPDSLIGRVLENYC
jgi:hypothetical protein